MSEDSGRFLPSSGRLITILPNIAYPYRHTCVLRLFLKEGTPAPSLLDPRKRRSHFSPFPPLREKEVVLRTGQSRKKDPLPKTVRCVLYHWEGKKKESILP